MIDPKKKYKTRDGREVRIYATDGGDIYPVHGAILCDGAWDHHGWTETGRFATWVDSHFYDLIEQPEEFDRGLWHVNIPRVGPPQGYSTREVADRNAPRDRIACLEIPIKGVVGQGLTK